MNYFAAGSPRLTQSQKDKLMAKIINGRENLWDCWIWKRGKMRSGYGSLRIPELQEHMLAHRASYLVFNGPIPPYTLVRHTCDNPRCVNPQHLLLGSHGNNVGDMLKRGRQRKATSKMSFQSP